MLNFCADCQTGRFGRAVVLALALAVCPGESVSADEVRILNWNVHEGFSAAGIKNRSGELKQLADRVRPDIVLLQEVTGIEVVRAVAEVMGLKDMYVACSDFAPTDAPDFTALEVGIISRYPLDNVVEYDMSPDYNPDKKDIPAEAPLAPSLRLGIRRPAEETRGYLWARIDAIKLTVAVVHLKSSRGLDGPEDFGNAQKREYVAAAIAEGVVHDRAQWPDYSVLVAGDINVGHSDRKKNGQDLYDDKTDGYDDTHAIFTAGVVGGLRMKNLTGEITEPTFPSFPSTPIDNIFVAGRIEAFQPVTLESETYGSDHRPNWTRYECTIDKDHRLPMLAAGHDVRLMAPPGAVAAGPVTGFVRPAEAAQYVGRVATVEFRVASAALVQNDTVLYCNSKDNFREDGNFALSVRGKVLKNLMAKGLNDPAKQVRGKTLRATGTITKAGTGTSINLESVDKLVVDGK